MIVAGTRPEVIKIAPIIWWLDHLGIDYVFVWSGQHYDYEMSGIFFEQLKLPKPHINLAVRSGSHAEQTARIMIGVEHSVKSLKPSIVVAQGDTNTTLASALASAKTLTPFAHVEAGLRSWDSRMPEEINRIVADTIAELNLAPTWLAAVNLTHCGVPLRKIHITGNTIVDVVYKYCDFVVEEGEKLLSKYELKPGKFILVTIHRQENTDVQWRLKNVVKALVELSKRFPVVFPAHPRTFNRLQRYGLLQIVRSHARILKPLGYFQFLGLLSSASIVLTDSGGVQEEAYLLGIPTLTLRYNTERPETVLAGTNIVIGVEASKIVETATKVLEARNEDMKPNRCDNMLGDGTAGEKIASILKNFMNKCSIEQVNTREDPYILHALLNATQIDCSFCDTIAAYDEKGLPTLETDKASKYLLRIPRSRLLEWLKNH